MRINRVDNVHFGITVKPPVRNEFDNGCYNIIREGAFKDYTFELYNSYRGDKLASTMMIVKKSGHWIKSKVKYELLGKRRTIWYYADDKKATNL